LNKAHLLAFGRGFKFARLLGLQNRCSTTELNWRPKLAVTLSAGRSGGKAIWHGQSHQQCKAGQVSSGKMSILSLVAAPLLIAQNPNRELALGIQSVVCCARCVRTKMSIESLQKELAALPAVERRRVQAFLVALQDSGDVAYGRKLSEKIDKPAEDFATLEQLDRRLKTGPGEEL
jgi:hypothetical protein